MPTITVKSHTVKAHRVKEHKREIPLVIHTKKTTKPKGKKPKH